MRYAKPHTSLQKQIELLTNRGMVIADSASALNDLSHIGYYRLRGYWIPFETTDATGNDHRFLAGTTFEQVLILYTFDRALRLLVNDAIERIEISVRNQWVDVLADAHGPHAYLDSSLFSSHRQYGRNLCAHHARLWNREVTVTMQLPRTKPASLIPSLDPGPDANQAPRRIYNTLVMLAYFMDCINPGHDWRERLFALLERHQVDVRQMGFPEDYTERAIWRS